MVSVISGGLGLEHRVEPLSAEATVTPVSTSTLRPSLPEGFWSTRASWGGGRSPRRGWWWPGVPGVPGAVESGAAGAVGPHSDRGLRQRHRRAEEGVEPPGVAPRVGSSA